jgi:hypothetical protein
MYHDADDNLFYELDEANFENMRKSSAFSSCDIIQLDVCMEVAFEVFVKPFSDRDEIRPVLGPVKLKTMAPNLKFFINACKTALENTYIDGIQMRDEFRPYIVTTRPGLDSVNNKNILTVSTINYEKKNISQETLSIRDAIIVFVKPPSYTSFKFLEIKEKHIEASDSCLPDIVAACNNTDQDKLFYLLSEDETKAISDKFEMDFIFRFVLVYIAMFNAITSCDAEDQESRRIVFNLWIMILCVMTGKRFNTDLNHYAKVLGVEFDRHGSGSVDYLLTPTVSADMNGITLLFLKEFWKGLKFSDGVSVKGPGDFFASSVSIDVLETVLNVMQRRVVDLSVQSTSTSSPAADEIEALNVAPTVTDTVMAAVTSAITELNANGAQLLEMERSDESCLNEKGSEARGSMVEAEDTNSDVDIDEVAAPGDDDAMDENMDGCNRPIVIHLVHQVHHDKQAGDALNVSTLNSSLGQLAMQMLDCFNLHAGLSEGGDQGGNPTKKPRKPPLVVKGILFTSHTSIFFEMTPGIKRPCLQYIGMTRIELFPKTKDRIGGLPTVITTKEVSSCLIQHYLFMTSKS